MPRLSEVTRHIRSKNAGPFWITVDIFFLDREGLLRYCGHPALQPASLAPVLGVASEQVECHRVPDLAVLKISYPRSGPQGGKVERDLHGGQQYVRLVDLDLS